MKVKDAICGVCAVEIEMKSPVDGDQKLSDAKAGDKSADDTVVELDGTRKRSSSAE